MTFAKVLEQLVLHQNKFAREGWNGKGMWIEKVKLGTLFDEIENPCLILKNVKGNYNTWIPSITDLFAEDWKEVI